MRAFFGLLFSRLFLCILLIAAQVAAIVFLCLFLPSRLPAALAVTGIYSLSALTAVALVGRDIPPEFKCAWLAFIAALPVFGSAVYLFTRWSSEKRTALPEPPAGFQPCERVVYFPDGASYFRSLFREIDRAEKYVYLEYYIIGEGVYLTRLTDRLRAAVRRGAEVKITVDGLGSALKLGRKKIGQLKRTGAQIKVFHKLFPFPLTRLNFRDHRKIAAIDGKVVFTGGINLADEYANVGSHFGYWKDTGVAVYGRTAELFAEKFNEVFCGRRGKGHDLGQSKDAQPRGRDLPASDGRVQAMPVFDAPPLRQGNCEDALVCAMERADRRIYAFTPYLCPDERLKRALLSAVRRGVDVKIVIPHIPDKKLTFELTKCFAEGLCAEGVGIYEFTPGFMHAKCVVCDDCALIGSYNLDYRSMNLNYECGIFFRGGIVDEVVGDFRACLAVSEPLRIKKAAALKRAVRSVLRLFAPLV